MGIHAVKPALSCYAWSGVRRMNHMISQSALFPLQWAEKHTLYYLSHFLVKNQQRPCHSPPAVNIFSGCERNRAAFPTPIITAIQFTAGLTFISVVRRKRACFITSSNNQPVRWSKQYYSVDVSVWYFTAHTEKGKVELFGNGWMNPPLIKFSG